MVGAPAGAFGAGNWSFSQKSECDFSLFRTLKSSREAKWIKKVLKFDFRRFQRSLNQTGRDIHGAASSRPDEGGGDAARILKRIEPFSPWRQSCPLMPESPALF